MNSKISIGLDVGNSDIKTRNTSTPSGFSSYQKAPFNVDNYLHYNGMFYVPEYDRFPYSKDKTQNDNLIKFSLFGIANEIIARCTQDFYQTNINRSLRHEDIQKRIDEIEYINLGFGLPPTHCASLSDKTIAYYYDRFNNMKSFEYNGYTFSLKLDKSKCYPQDFAAIVGYNPKDRDSIIKNFDSYYAIDIGGYTVDIITIVNGKPSLQKSDSKPLGIITMYNSMIQEIDIEEGIRLTMDTIEKVLLNKPTILDDSTKKIIYSKTESWYHHIINELIQFGLDFSVYPAIFLGGGSLMYWDYIKNDPIIKKCELISNPNANAIAYEKLISNIK